MRQMPEWQFFDGKVFPPALCANATIRGEVTTLAFVNQMHCIRLAYLDKVRDYPFHFVTQYRTQASNESRFIAIHWLEVDADESTERSGRGQHKCLHVMRATTSFAGRDS